MESLDAYYDEMADAEDDYMDAKRLFEEADDELRRALQREGMSLAAYRESRASRGLKP